VRKSQAQGGLSSGSGASAGAGSGWLDDDGHGLARECGWGVHLGLGWWGGGGGWPRGLRGFRFGPWA
jgi:hypothetical protein